MDKKREDQRRGSIFDCQRPTGKQTVARALEDGLVCVGLEAIDEPRARLTVCGVQRLSPERDGKLSAPNFPGGAGC
jgi:hypothetical protein